MGTDNDNSAVIKKLVNVETQILFVSGSAADQIVLSALIGRGESASGVEVSSAPTAPAFYEALHSEKTFHVIVVDEAVSWSPWRSVVMSISRHRRNALLILLVADGEREVRRSELGQYVAAVYPRESGGLLALANLVTKLAAQGRSFSLRQHADPEAEDEGLAEERETLVYAVSHDLQDPLQLAKRYADVLGDDYRDKLGEAGHKVLEHLQFNLGRTQEILDELLDFSKLQGNAPDREPVDLDALLDETVELYRVTLDEIGGIVTRQRALPTLMVDRRQMQRLLQNLIGNAIKFRSERPLHVAVRAQRVRDEWRIGIKDNGVGIAEQDAKRIFRMFERVADTEGVDMAEGMGMGLAICKRIIDNHGGKIWVRSSPGNGSVFIFSIPQSDDEFDMIGA